MTEHYPPGRPEETQPPAVLHAESIIFEDQNFSIGVLQETVDALNESGLTSLSILPVTTPTLSGRQQFLFRNNLDLSQLGEERIPNSGFGPLWAAEAIVHTAAAKKPEVSTDPEDVLNKDKVDSYVGGAAVMQVADFQKNPQVFDTFVECLEQDSPEAVSELIDVLRRPTDTTIIDLARFPAIAEYMINSHEEHPEFVRAVFHSTSLPAHVGMYLEMRAKLATVPHRRPHKLVLNYLATSYVDSLLEAATDSEFGASNPFARANVSHFYTDFFGEKGFFAGKRTARHDPTQAFIDDLHERFLQAGMKSPHKEMRDMAAGYFLKNIHSLPTQLLVFATTSQNIAENREKEHAVLPFARLAFEQDSDALALLDRFYSPQGEASDFNKALGAMILELHGNTKKHLIDSDTALMGIMRCLAFFHPLVESDSEVLKTLQAIHSFPPLVRKRLDALLSSQQ